VIWQEPELQVEEEMPGPVGHTLPQPPQLLASEPVLVEQSVLEMLPQVAQPVEHWQVPSVQLPWPEHGGFVEQEGLGGDWK